MGERSLEHGSFVCPVPLDQYPVVLLAHGGGGKLMHELVAKMFLASFRNPWLEARHDGAVFRLEGKRIAFTTDSYVVRPLFFPGGNIGTLAVNGTVNDLAMCGARPLYLSVGLVLEEGLPMETLWRVISSMAEAARQAGVQIVTGDTKVVDKGKGDGLFINTSGVGVIEHDLPVSPSAIQVGDAVILSGDIGRHGIAIMAARESLQFETEIESDCAPLHQLTSALFEHGIAVHCLRDLTRGGLATALLELAETSGTHIVIHEDHIAVRDDVRGACEILGLDPLYVANEGRFVAFVPAHEAERALELLRSRAMETVPAIIGEVEATPRGHVTLRSRLGTSRFLHMLSGEQLPRIC